MLEAHATTGPGDLHCRVVARTNEHLQTVINKILSVTRHQADDDPDRADRAARLPRPAAGQPDHQRRLTGRVDCARPGAVPGHRPIALLRPRRRRAAVGSRGGGDDGVGARHEPRRSSRPRGPLRPHRGGAGRGRPADGRARRRRRLREEHDRGPRLRRIGYRLDARRPCGRARPRVPVEPVPVARAAATGVCEVDLIEPVGDAGALPLERFADALAAAPTRVVAVSWVQFGRGLAHRPRRAGRPVPRARGAAVRRRHPGPRRRCPPTSRRGASTSRRPTATSGSSAPKGSASSTSPSRVRDQLRPLEPGWNSVPHRGEWNNRELVWDDSARRFEGGTPNVAGTMGLGASLDLLLAAGADTDLGARPGARRPAVRWARRHRRHRAVRPFPRRAVGHRDVPRRRRRLGAARRRACGTRASS